MSLPGMTARLIGFVAVFSVGVKSANADLIVGYSGQPMPVETTAAGTTNANLERGPGVGVAGGGNYATNSWTTASTPDVNNDYIEWGYTSAPLYGWDLDQLLIQYKKTGSGPDDLQIRISVNGGGFTTIFTDTSVSTQNEFHAISLAAYNQVTSAIFRLYGYNANNASGQLDMTNFTFTPSAYAIQVTGFVATPEPGSLAVFGLGGVIAGLVGVAKKRQKRRVG